VTYRQLESSAYILAATSVALAALGAHLLKDHWHDEAAPNQFATATRILFWHSIGIWICSRPSLELSNQGLSMLVSSLVFCGSVYLLSFGAPSWLGMIAPLGGLGLIGTWAWMAWSRTFATKHSPEKS